MADTWLDRLKREERELRDRHEKLAGFLEQKEFLMLPTEDRNDLKAQRACMFFYLTILQRRLDRHLPKEEIV